jgi:hypothetical protein
MASSGYRLPPGVTAADVLARDAEILRSEGIEYPFPDFEEKLRQLAAENSA